MPEALDPDKHRERLYRLKTRYIEKLEAGADGRSMSEFGENLHLALKIEVEFDKLGKSSREPDRTGSAVRKYQNSFAATGTGGREGRAGRAAADPAAELYPDSGDEPAA